MRKPEIGTHLARPRAGTLSTFGKQNRPCVVVEFTLSADHNCGDIWIGWLGDSVGKDGKSLTERTTETLRTCGWEGDDLSDISFPADAQVEIVVEDEEYEGRVTRKIQFVNEVGGGFRPRPMALSEAKKLAERLMPKVRGGKPAPRKPSPPPAGDGGMTPPEGIDDDIPF